MKWRRDWSNATGSAEEITYLVDTVTKRDDIDFLMRKLERSPELSHEWSRGIDRAMIGR